MSSSSDLNRAIWSERPPQSVLGESRVKRVFEILGEMTPGSILDLGCGAGYVTAEMADRGWSVVGAELVGKLALAARGRVGAVVVADCGGRSLPFRSDSFDVVFAGELIEHVIDTDALLSEIGRIVRHGGMVIITTPNLASFENRLRLLLGLYPIWVEFRSAGEGHVRAYTPRVLKRQLREHGFQLRRHLGNWVPVVPQRFVNDQTQPWLGRTGRWLPSLSMDIIVAAQRFNSQAGD